MFFRRKPAPEPPAVDVTNDAFRRWLRAHRPPLLWFLGLSEDEQETLALIGDEHAQQTAIDFGYAIADPQLAEAGIGAAEGDGDAEEALLRPAAGRR